MKKKKKGRGGKAQPPVFVFTPVSIQVTQKAMQLFEQSLQRAKSASEKIAFSRTVMERVNEKLHLMSSSAGLLRLTTFDYNEKIVIAAAIKQYEVAILFNPLTAEKRKELRVCKQIGHFASTGSGFQITFPTHD
jgi:hypothetical protein